MSDSVTEPMGLMPQDLGALHRATRLTFTVNGGHAQIAAYLSKPVVTGWSADVRSMFPVGDDTERMRHIPVAHDLFERIGKYDVPGDHIASAYTGITGARYDLAWQSVVSLLRQGDRIHLSFRGDAPGQLPDGWHVDQLVLSIRRPGMKPVDAEFALITQIAQGEDRMVHLIDPKTLARAIAQANANSVTESPLQEAL